MMPDQKLDEQLDLLYKMISYLSELYKEKSAEKMKRLEDKLK